MTRDYIDLQRRPFLTPIWLFVLIAGLGLLCFGFAAWALGTAQSTTVIVVRHAEKEASGKDPPLTPAGEARAGRLAMMFGRGGVPGHLDAIYITQALRNRMTAAPLAARLGITPIVAAANDPREFARRVLHEHQGGKILVIAHRDSISQIVQALSRANNLPQIDDDEYATMYIVSVPRIGRANLLRVTY